MFARLVEIRDRVLPIFPRSKSGSPKIETNVPSVVYGFHLTEVRNGRERTLYAVFPSDRDYTGAEIVYIPTIGEVIDLPGGESIYPNILEELPQGARLGSIDDLIGCGKVG